MSHPGPAVDASPAAFPDEEPPSEDGWRGSGRCSAIDPDTAGPVGSLGTLRAELDLIDDTLHDLLMRRATVVEQVARAGKPAAFRPGREATILRRLIERHHGSLPPASVIRIWRELLAGTTAMQGGFSLAVCDADPGAELTQVAREHFGALTPLRLHGGAGQALADVSQGDASAAVLPFPSDASPWWVALLHHEPRLHIIARLPFWGKRPEGAPTLQALVVAAAPPDASADDRSFLGFECDSGVSRARLSSQLAPAGLPADLMVLRREPGSAVAHLLAEVDGYLADDDPRLGRLGAVLRRPVVIGRYAVPFAASP